MAFGFDVVLPCVLCLIAILLVVYLYLTWYFGYWEKQGIKCDKPCPPLGTLKSINEMRLEEQDMIGYKKFDRFFGIYEGRTPALIVGDPDLVKQILVKDFSSFCNHRQFELSHKEILLQKMLFNMTGEEWKAVRNVISPTFTSGKLKQMISIMEQYIDLLNDHISKFAETEEPVNVVNVFQKLTIDVIANCAFGVELNSFKSPQNPFAEHSQKLISASTPVMLILFLMPGLAKYLPPLFSQEAIGFFEKRVIEVLELRKQFKEERKDFLDLLLKAQKEEMELKPEERVLTTQIIIAQCIVFLFAGNETSAITLSHMAYSLALNLDVQEKLISEIDDIILKHHGKIDYDVVQNMQYLDQVLNETLRMYPPVVRTDRQCEQDDYKLQGATLKKNMVVVIPIYCIHHDEEFYPDPDVFDPDRFSPERKAERNPYTFLPFGIGPRACVGMRFALMQIKLTMVHLLSKYRIVTSHKTEVPLKFNKTTPEFLQPVSVTLTFKKRRC